MSFCPTHYIRITTAQVPENLSNFDDLFRGKKSALIGNSYHERKLSTRSAIFSARKNCSRQSKSRGNHQLSRRNHGLTLRALRTLHPGGCPGGEFDSESRSVFHGCVIGEASIIRLGGTPRIPNQTCTKVCAFNSELDHHRPFRRGRRDHGRIQTCRLPLPFCE